MPQHVYIWGWDATNRLWVKCLVTPQGKLIIDPSEILENSPSDGQVGKAPTSNWAFDHKANPDAHHAHPSPPEMLSYDDATLSGTPIIIRFADGGAYIHIKFYPTISASANATADPLFTDSLTLLNARLFGSGELVAFRLNTGGTDYYINGYQHVDTPPYNAGLTLLTAGGYPNLTLAGTPRIIKIVVDGTPYYVKAYPDKS